MQSMYGRLCNSQSSQPTSNHYKMSEMGGPWGQRRQRQIASGYTHTQTRTRTTHSLWSQMTSGKGRTIFFEVNHWTELAPFSSIYIYIYHVCVALAGYTQNTQRNICSGPFSVTTQYLILCGSNILGEGAKGMEHRMDEWAYMIGIDDAREISSSEEGLKPHTHTHRAHTYDDWTVFERNKN